MEISNLIPHIEALIFASEKPLTTLELTDVINNAFGFMEDKITLDQVESAVEGIIEKYRAEFYPFEVRESGGGWQFLTKRAFHKTVAQLNGDKFLKRLSTAALETLSIIAYKQPVTKGEIEVIRGVSSDYAIQKLLEKDLIVITGRNEKLPGHPLVYATSKNFMDYFGINSPEDLPKLKEIFDESILQPTIVNEEAPRAEDEAELNGELTEPGEEEPLAETQEAEETSQFVVREDGALIDESEGQASSEEQTEAGNEGGEEEENEELTEEERTIGELEQDTFEQLEAEEDEEGDEEDESAYEDDLDEEEEDDNDGEDDDNDEEDGEKEKKPNPGDN